LEGIVETTFGLSGSKLIIDLSDRQAYFYTNGSLAGHYEIAVGRSGWETPIGEFNVINMQVDPAWQHPFTGEVIHAGAENPLGSRWIGFWTDGTHQIGLHGTNQEDLIGQAVSHGCIRLREADVQALYDQISIDTPVIVRP
jgi:lipoprotein-anchoring transpeptidase ErfK/SrfK